jgi:hypothetical protein
VRRKKYGNRSGFLLHAPAFAIDQQPLTGNVYAMTRWDAELADEQRRAKKKVYNRTYRRRHPERERLFEPLYKIRWKTRQRGLNLSPLPDWSKELGAFELSFPRGPQPGHGGRPPKLFSSSLQKINYCGQSNFPFQPSSKVTPTERAAQPRAVECGEKPRDEMASRYPGEVRRVSCRCLICGRPFMRSKSHVARRENGNFCTRQCYTVSQRLFRLAVQTGRFEEIMKGLAAILRDEEKAA